MNKKGMETQYFRMFEIIMAAIVVLGILLFAKGVTEGTDLEKEYLSRDIALLLDTIYASPGDVSYTYYLDKNKLDIQIAKGQVIVSENGLRPATQAYAEDAEFKNLAFTMQKPQQITFIKKGKELKIEGKMQ